jgi:hypothetical protein
VLIPVCHRPFFTGAVERDREVPLRVPHARFLSVGTFLPFAVPISALQSYYPLCRLRSPRIGGPHIWCVKSAVIQCAKVSLVVDSGQRSIFVWL